MKLEDEIFSELFSQDYNITLKVIRELLSKHIDVNTAKDLINIISKFTDSYNIQERLSNYLSEMYLPDNTNIKDPPLSTLQKKWIYSLFQDPRIKLFIDSELEFKIKTFDFNNILVYYDQKCDGDPYDDELYQRVFKTLLKAIKENRICKLVSKNQECILAKPIERFIPKQIEYSERDDKFRVLGISLNNDYSANLQQVLAISRIVECVLGDVDKSNYSFEEFKKESIKLEITNIYDTVDRFLRDFSDMDTFVKKLNDNTFEVELTYYLIDQREIIIRILEYGPNVKVIGPEKFLRSFKERLQLQFNRNHN